MMQRIAVTATATGYSTVVPLDRYANPASTSLAAIVTSTATSGITFSAQYTLDECYATTFTASGATWFNTSATTLTSATGTVAGSIGYPATAVVLNVAALPAGSTIQFVVQQTGSPL